MSCISIDYIYCNYKNDIYRYLYYLCRNHHNAEDLTQETISRAWENLERLDNRNIKAWLLRVAYNAYIDKLRKESRYTVYENDFFNRFTCTCDDDLPESCVLRQENWKELFDQLAELNTNQQQAVLLYDIQGFSYQEAADMMGIQLSHFKIVLYRARQNLRHLRKTA